MSLSIRQPVTAAPEPGAGNPVDFGVVICPACGWRDNVLDDECGSCGGSLAGVPVRREMNPTVAKTAVVRHFANSSSLPLAEKAFFSVSKRWGLMVLVLAGILWGLSDHPVRYQPGMLVGSQPKQGDAEGVPPWALKDGTIVRPLATYEITARLLHRERYRWDGMSDIAPVDLGVGWHRMSDQSVIDGYHFSNHDRYLSFQCDNTPDSVIDPASTANMHMLPANEEMRDRLLDLSVGEVFFASGYLVCVDRPGMHPWSSSLSREDTGMGACEIMWIKEIRKVRPHGIKES